MACFQFNNKINITGKLDEPTLLKLKNNFDTPRNFAIVIPKKLYRGGIIDNIEQLKNLKNNFGVERIISLHNNPNIGRMCGEVGIEHLPAPIETGSSEEYGRKILGDRISDLLLEKPTYIHCWFGEDRTGGVIARFRTENGWSNKDAYIEAKSFGFKDFFSDLIDWFSEVNKDEPPPIDTKMVREIVEKLNLNIPYKNPEITEQDAQFTPPANPSDTPYYNPYDKQPNYERWTDTMININPAFSLTVPLSIM